MPVMEINIGSVSHLYPIQCELLVHIFLHIYLFFSQNHSKAWICSRVKMNYDKVKSYTLFNGYSKLSLRRTATASMHLAALDNTRNFIYLTSQARPFFSFLLLDVLTLTTAASVL